MRKEILFSVWLMVMGFVRAGVADQEVPAEAQPDWQDQYEQVEPLMKRAVCFHSTGCRRYIGAIRKDV